MKRCKENMIGFYTLARREIVRFLRIWVQTLVPPVITVVLYFVIFGNLIGPRIGQMGGVPYIEYIVPGLIMMSIITSSYTNVVFSFFSAKFQRNIEELLVSPMPNAYMLMGYTLGGVARGLCAGILVAFASLFFSKLKLYSISLTFLVAFLTALLFSLAGLVNGVFAKKFDDASIVPTFILTPLTYLGGVFYSISLLPAFWRTLSYANPIFYMINAFRYAILGYSDLHIGISLSVIMGFVVVFYIWSLWLIDKGVGLRQ